MAAESRPQLTEPKSGAGPAPWRRLRAVALAWLAFAWLAGTASATELRWQAAESDVDRALANYLADSNIVSDLLVLASANLALDPPLAISIGSGLDGSRAPSYSPEERRIRLPYAYFEDAIGAQATLGEASPDEDAVEEGQAVRRALAMIEYTLYHLLGHALVDDADPSADAAAEAVSSWLMLSGWPNGAEQWLVASRAFAAASQRLDGPLEDYWHSHALYRINERTHACWALGADPERIEPLLPASLEPAERRERCARSWQRLDARVRQMLDGVLAADAPLRKLSEPAEPRQ